MAKSIEVRGLEVVYSDRGRPFTALSDVNLDIETGEFVSIVGPSGCGKSTLLSVLEGLVAPTAGSVVVEGNEVRGPGPERNVVFQQYSLFPWMTARANVAFAIKQAQRGNPGGRMRRKDRDELADRYLAKVALEGFGHRYPKELSGGQQQRVAIARAMAGGGSVLLMDEPFGAIDARNRIVLQDLLLELWEGESGSRRKTVVFVTHDLEEAILLSDRIILLGANPGRVREQYTVPLPRPRRRLGLINNPVYIKFRSDVSKAFLEDEPMEVHRP